MIRKLATGAVVVLAASVLSVYAFAQEDEEAQWQRAASIVERFLKISEDPS